MPAPQLAFDPEKEDRKRQFLEEECGIQQNQQPSQDESLNVKSKRQPSFKTTLSVPTIRKVGRKPSMNMVNEED